MKRRNFVLSGVALASMLATGAFAQGSETSYPASYDEIVEASKAEGSVLIYQNMNSDVWAEVKSGFETKYPWLKVSTLDLEANEVIERYLSETATGRPSADLLVTVSPDLWLDFAAKGKIEPYVSPEAAAYQDWAKPLPGLYTMTADPIIILYNKMLLPPDLVPTGMADLVEKVTAHPDVFSGRITTYAANLNTYGYVVQYGLTHGRGEQAWDWYKALAPHTHAERGAGPMAEKVASGEYVLAYMTGSATSWAAARAPGGDQLLGWTFIGDGTPVVPRSMAVPVGAAHPNAAKLMLDYILSREGQLGFAKTHRTVIRPDVSAEDASGEFTYASVAEQIGNANMLNVPYDEDIVTGYAAFIERWNSLFGG